MVFPFLTTIFPFPQYTVKERYSLQFKTATRFVAKQLPCGVSRIQDRLFLHPPMTISIGCSFICDFNAIWASLHACTWKLIKFEPLVEIPYSSKYLYLYFLVVEIRVVRVQWISANNSDTCSAICKRKKELEMFYFQNLYHAFVSLLTLLNKVQLLIFIFFLFLLHLL